VFWELIREITVDKAKKKHFHAIVAIPYTLLQQTGVTKGKRMEK
jgi:hypothetical protein